MAVMAVTNEEVARAVRAAVTELLDIQRPDTRPVELMVIGCSTSEIAGGRIGKASVPELGEAVARAAWEAASERGVELAFQCCEHLNRALVTRREAARRFGYEEVCAVPWPKAGGPCASAAWRMLPDPVLVESVRADAGLDIGLTLIGMHLKSVAIPIRLSVPRVGEAILTAALTRPRLIGGERARYTL